MGGPWRTNCKCKVTTNPTKCLSEICLSQIQKERENLFGKREDSAPTSKERSARLADILKTRSTFSANDMVSVFKLF